MREFVSGRPVWELYADTGALEIACPECGVVVESPCIWRESGKTRKSPCGGRVRAAREALRKDAGK